MWSVRPWQAAKAADDEKRSSAPRFRRGESEAESSGYPDELYCVYAIIHNRIAVLRAERSLSRTQLALRVGVNPQTIGFLERRNYTPSLELAFKISRFFRLPMEAVFSPDPFRPLSEQVYTLERREA